MVKTIRLHKRIADDRYDQTATQGLLFFAKTMLEFGSADHTGSIYDALTNRLREYTGALFCGVALFNDQNGVGTVRSVAGSKEDLEQLRATISAEFIGLPIRFTAEMMTLFQTHTVQRLDGVWTLLQNTLSRAQAEEMASAMGTSECHLFPLWYHDQLLGAGAIVLPPERTLSHGQTATIATLAHLFAISLHHLLVEEACLQAEHRLHDSEARYAHLFNQSGVAILVTDGYKILDANALTLDMLGFRAEELIGQDLLPLLARMRPDLPALARTRIEATLAGHPQTFEMNLARSGNRRMTAEARMVASEFQGHTLIQAILRDVTERKQSEQALRQSESRYRELFTGSRDGILITDLQDRIIDVNQAYLDLLGYDTPEDLLHKPLLELVPPEYQPLEASLETRLMSGGDTGEYEMELFRRDGGRVLVRKRRWLSRDEQNNPIGRWSIIRDITHLRRMENEVGAVEKFRLLGELAATISHEVRNPLTTVRGFLQYFLSENHYRPQDQEYFELMISELDSATTIIADFLDIARPSGPKRQLLSLSQVISSLARVMASKGIMQKVEIICQIADSVAIMADPTQIREVFVNIIQNAFQAMPEGGTLTIGVDRHDQEAVVTIGDTGCGIPPESIERLGRPFFTTKAGGTGLGLSACYRIVDAHQGRITVHSEVGMGTTFTVFLPTL